MNSAFGESFMFLTKLAWNCKVTLPILVTAVFLALDFRMQIELNIETEQIVFQDDVDDSDIDDSEIDESESDEIDSDGLERYVETEDGNYDVDYVFEAEHGNVLNRSNDSENSTSGFFI